MALSSSLAAAQAIPSTRKRKRKLTYTIGDDFTPKVSLPPTLSSGQSATPQDPEAKAALDRLAARKTAEMEAAAVSAGQVPSVLGTRSRKEAKRWVKATDDQFAASQQGARDTAGAPEHAALRRNRNSLEGVMAAFDARYADMPQADREAFKYRMQALLDPSSPLGHNLQRDIAQGMNPIDAYAKNIADIGGRSREIAARNQYHAGIRDFFHQAGDEGPLAYGAGILSNLVGAFADPQAISEFPLQLAQAGGSAADYAMFPSDRGQTGTELGRQMGEFLPNPADPARSDFETGEALGSWIQVGSPLLHHLFGRFTHGASLPPDGTMPPAGPESSGRSYSLEQPASAPIDRALDHALADAHSQTPVDRVLDHALADAHSKPLDGPSISPETEAALDAIIGGKPTPEVATPKPHVAPERIESATPKLVQPGHPGEPPVVARTDGGNAAGDGSGSGASQGSLVDVPPELSLEPPKGPKPKVKAEPEVQPTLDPVNIGDRHGNMAMDLPEGEAPKVEPKPAESAAHKWSDSGDVVVARPKETKRDAHHADHAAAKAGDVAAANRVVADTVSDRSVAEVKRAIGDTKPVVVAVSMATEGTNALPLAYANELGKRLGLDVDTSIVQSTRANRTGSGIEHRLQSRPEFAGDVVPGQSYLLVDDHLTTGGTLRDLQSYIESRGGKVVARTTLTGEPISGKAKHATMLEGGVGRRSIAASAAQIETLRNKYDGIDERLKQSFGHGADGLTNAEASHFITHPEAVEAMGKGGSGAQAGDAPPNTRGGGLGKQAGVADPKTLAAAIGGIGAAMFAGPYIAKWLNENKDSLPLIGLGALAALTGTAIWKGRGFKAFVGEQRALRPGVSMTVLEKEWDAAKGIHGEMMQALLDPQKIADRLKHGDIDNPSVRHHYGELIQNLVAAFDRRLKLHLDLASGLKKAYEKHFPEPKKGTMHPEAVDLDRFKRDEMERANANGIKPSEFVERGILTQRQYDFLSDVQKQWDRYVDRAEKLGIRVRTELDAEGKQADYAGDRPVWVNGKEGRIVRDQLEGTYDPEDPFGPIGNDGVRVRFTDGTEQRLQVGDTFSRTINRMGLSYVPRVFSDGFMEQIRHSKDAAFGEALKKMLMEENGIDEIRADKELTRLRDEIASGHGPTDPYSLNAHLEKARQLNLAKFEYVDKNGELRVVDPYESSLFNSFATYSDRMAKRIAIAEAFGPDPVRLRDAVQSMKGGDRVWGDYFEKLLGRTFQMGDEAPKPSALAHKAARLEGAWQAMSKLTSGTTHFAQVSDLLFPATRVETANLWKGIWRSLDKSAREHVSGAAVIDAAFKLEIGGVDSPKTFKERLRSASPTDKAQIVARAVMDGIGLSATDRFVKAQTHIIALQDIESKLTRASQFLRQDKPVPIGLERALAKYDIGMSDIRQAAAKSVADVMGSEVFQDRIHANVRRTMTYSGRVTDMPLSWSTDAGSVMMRFKKQYYVATRYLLQDVLGEAAKGNYKPLGKFLTYATIGGSAVTMAKDMISGRFDWDKTLLSDVLRGDFFGALHSAGQAIYDSGGTGVFGEMTGFNRRLVDSATGDVDPKAILPPLVSDAVNVTSGVKHATEDILDGRADRAATELDSMGRGMFAPYRVARRVLGGSPSYTRYRELERKAQNGKLDPSEFDEYRRLAEANAEASPRKDPKPKVQRDLVDYMHGKGLTIRGDALKARPRTRPPTAGSFKPRIKAR